MEANRVAEINIEINRKKFWIHKIETKFSLGYRVLKGILLCDSLFQ